MGSSNTSQSLAIYHGRKLNLGRVAMAATALALSLIVMLNRGSTSAVAGLTTPDTKLKQSSIIVKTSKGLYICQKSMDGIKVNGLGCKPWMP